MDTQFDGQKMTRIAIYALLWIYAGFPLLAESNNSVWLGHIRDFKIYNSDVHSVLVEVALQEYIAEGTFDDFDEDKIVYINKNTNLTEWIVYLDNIAAGKFSDYHHQYSKKKMPFWQGITITTQQGGYTDPNKTETAEGKPITTSKLVLTGDTPFYIYLESVEKDNPSEVQLLFKMTDQIPEQKLTSKKKGNILEICANDFERDKPVGNFISEVDPKNITPKTQQCMNRLQQMSPGTFVTLIYQVKNQDVNTLKSQLDSIKSEVGEVKGLANNAQIMIRDRSEYVLEMLYLLLAMDIPIPQVIIDVQIIERNLEDSKDFSSSFQYLHDDPKNNFDGSHSSPGQTLIGPLQGKQISGVYQHLDKGFLNQFQYQMNLEIKKGKAKMKASTRIICKNREVAQFHSGNQIPYYQFDEYDYKDRDYRYDTKEHSESGNDDPLTSTSYTNRKFAYKERDINTNRKWRLKFINIGVNLWIQPYIKNSDWVELVLKPSYTEITSRGSYSNIPILSNRSIDTTVTVKNGDTFLVAGLLYEKNIQAIRGIPLLMDIPLLGYLFSSEFIQKLQTEIIFILTVYIQYPGS